MTLRNLLDLTSGLVTEPKCMNDPYAKPEACVKDIALQNANNGKIPGKEFWYSGIPFQVAGMMAIKARGVNSWQDLYSAFQAKTKLFPTSTFDLPSASNPRLGGGMHWTGNEYLAFIKAYDNGKLLSPKLQTIAMSDQLVGVFVPPAGNPSLRTGQDWHYGLALWLECPDRPFDCTTIDSYSCAGTYGAYPFMNVKYNFYGILARQGQQETGYKGFDLYNSIQPEVINWASKNCTVPPGN